MASADRAASFIWLAIPKHAETFVAISPVDLCPWIHRQVAEAAVREKEIISLRVVPAARRATSITIKTIVKKRIAFVAEPPVPLNFSADHRHRRSSGARDKLVGQSRQYQ